MNRLHLTYRALSDIDDIYTYSDSQWGASVANQYLNSIEETLLLIQQYPELVKVNPKVSSRFCIYPVREHFLVLDKIGNDLYLLTVQSQKLDLLTEITKLAPSLEAEVQALYNTLKKGRY